MTSRLSRRAFTRTLAAGLGLATFPFEAGAREEAPDKPRTLKIGCTALIWGAVPRTP